MSWPALAAQAPELAAFGARRLHDQVAYLATVKADGAPRLHPVRPVISANRLFLFIEPSSPKVRDLRHDGRYALHCTATGDQPWDLNEFCVDGVARPVDDTAGRAVANSGTSFPRDDRFVLFDLDVAAVLSTQFGPDGRPMHHRWRSGSGGRQRILN